MLSPTAKSVKPICAYKILVEFDNGENKEFDVKPYINGDFYGRLSDMEYFNKASIDGYTVVWPEGQDICPDELYELSTPV